MKRTYGELAGMPEGKRHFHMLKYSIATHLLDAGADLRFVQDWIGHASIKNTVIYAQLTSRRREEEARKLFATRAIVELRTTPRHSLSSSSRMPIELKPHPLTV